MVPPEEFVESFPDLERAGMARDVDEMVAQEDHRFTDMHQRLAHRAERIVLMIYSRQPRAGEAIYHNRHRYCQVNIGVIYWEMPFMSDTLAHVSAVSFHIGVTLTEPSCGKARVSDGFALRSPYETRPL